MTLNQPFKQTLQARLQADTDFRHALFAESLTALLAGDVDTGKAVLRDYIKATVGFEKLGEKTGTSPKSLMRMFSPSGNPQARNLFAVIHQLQRHARITLRVASSARSTRSRS